VSAVHTNANTVTVQWSEVNDAGQSLADAHGDPNPVTISFAGANIETRGGGGDNQHVGPTTAGPDRSEAQAGQAARGGVGGTGGTGPSGVSGPTAGGMIRPGDQVEFEATTSAGGNRLVAVHVHDEPNWQDRQNYPRFSDRADTTANTITVQWGGHHGGDSEATPPDGGSGGSGPTAGATIQPGNRVEVEATTTADGNGLVALHVHDEQGG
jgi:hypothetical protein